MGENMDEKFIEIFVEELYAYCLPKRLGIAFRRERVPNSDNVDVFTPDVGKAVLLMCHAFQANFEETFKRHYSDLKNDSYHFFRLSAETGFPMYVATVDDIFESTVKIGAMILELVAFCYEENFFPFSPLRAHICWSSIFNHHLKQSFFEKGGWIKQIETSEKYARTFDRQFDIPNPTIYYWVGIKWLKRTIFYISPSKSCASNIGINKMVDDADKIQNSEVKLSTQRENPAHELNPPLAQNTILKLKTEVVEDEMPNNEVMSEVQAISSRVEYLSLSNSPIKVKSPMELGAITKTIINTAKYSKKSDIELEADNELVKSFASIFMSEASSWGNDLWIILSSDTKKKLLMNDRSFIRLMKETVENPEKKPDNEKLLEYAQRIIGSYPENSHHLQDNLFSEIDRILETKLDFEEKLQEEFILETDRISKGKCDFAENQQPLDNFLSETDEPFEREYNFSEKLLGNFLPETNRTFERKCDFENIFEEYEKSRDLQIFLDGKYELQSLSALPRENIKKDLDLKSDDVAKSVKLVIEQDSEASRQFRREQTITLAKTKLELIIQSLNYLIKFLIILNVKLNSVSKNKRASESLSPNSKSALTKYADKKTLETEAKIYLKKLFVSCIKDEEEIPAPIPEDILTLKLIREGVRKRIKISVQKYSDINYADIYQLVTMALMFNPEEYSIEHGDIQAQILKNKKEILRATKFTEFSATEVNVSNCSFKTESDRNCMATTELYNENIRRTVKESSETSHLQQNLENGQDEETFTFKEIKDYVMGFWKEHINALKLLHSLRLKIMYIPGVLSNLVLYRSNPDKIKQLSISLHNILGNVGNFKGISIPPIFEPKSPDTSPSSKELTKLSPKKSGKSYVSYPLTSIDLKISRLLSKSTTSKLSPSSLDFLSTSLQTSSLPLRLSDEYQLPGNRCGEGKIKTEMETACMDLSKDASSSCGEELNTTQPQTTEDGCATSKESSGLSSEKNICPRLRISFTEEGNETAAAGSRKKGKRKKKNNKRRR